MPINGNRAAALDGLVRPDDGRVSRRIFIDPELYEQELSRVFTQSWLFLAHASEIPAPATTSRASPAATRS